MTTPEAAKLYEAQHVAGNAHREFHHHNPHNKPFEELPIIYGFNNGGSASFYSACLLSEDGIALGSHLCSSEAYMTHDLGMLEGRRQDRQETFQKHYPDGYRMEFVSMDNVEHHGGLNNAFKLNQEKYNEEKTS